MGGIIIFGINNNNNDNKSNNNSKINKKYMNSRFYESLIVFGLILTLFMAFNVAFTENTSESINSLQKIERSNFNSLFENMGLLIFKEDDSNSKVINKFNAATEVYSTSNSDSNSNSKSSSKPSSVNPPKFVYQSSILAASKNLKKYATKNNKLPDSVIIGDYKYSIPEFTYMTSKTIQYKNNKFNSPVTVKYNVKNPIKPSGTTIKAKISSKLYFTYAIKTLKYMNKYNQAPNYINAGKNVKIPYQTGVLMFASVLTSVYDKKKLPTSISLSVSKFHKINQYVPNYVRSSNKNAIWIQSKDFNNVDFAKLSKYGIGNVFLHEAAISQYGKSKVVSWAKNAANNGIKTHLWIQCFYSNGKWINPVNPTTKSYNTAQFKIILSKIKNYCQMDHIRGIHLDYLRYPGTTYKYKYSNGVSGEKAISMLVNKARTYIDIYNPNALLSASVMPETSSNAYYYGQNIPQMGKYLDIITPMIYKGNYGQNTNWIKSTTSWFSKNSGGAQIWSGLQTYVSDNNPIPLSATNLKADCLAALNGGADGLALFRWGLTSFLDFLGLYN